MDRCKVGSDTCNIIGDDAKLCKHLRLLYMLVGWHRRAGVGYAPDPRHAQLLNDAMAVRTGMRLITPGVKVADARAARS